MRILFLTPAYSPFPGGGERYVSSLARELVRRDHSITVITSTAQTERDLWQGTADEQVVIEKDDGVEIMRCPLRPFPGGRNGLMAWRKGMVLFSMLPGEQTAVLGRMARLIPPLPSLRQILSQLPDRFDLAHGFNLSWEHTLVAGWRYARQQQIPFVVTPFTHLGTGQDRVARNSTMDHQLRLMHEASRVLALTSIEKEGLAALGIPPTRLDVVNGGLDPLPPFTDTADLQKRYGLPRPYAIFIGRASYEKGAIHAAQAILALRAQGMEISLALVGQLSPEFERFTARLSNRERRGIRPLGILSDSDKHGLLAEAGALLLPSRTDSFGIVLLEAWAHGKPVIGANAGGIPGVIDDGKNGILVEFGDVPAISHAVYRLWTDPALNKKLGQNGRDKVKAVYAWNRVGSRVLSNYRIILNGRENQ